MENHRNIAIKTHKDLEVWSKAREVTKLIYLITDKFPGNERFGLISQLRRAAVSVPTNIAEGFGRIYPGELIHFLNYSQGSLSEVDTLLILSLDLNYISNLDFEKVEKKIIVIRIMLSGLIKSIQNHHKK